MMIHPDQKNVAALCELADFIDSGFQSFREQTRERRLTPENAAEAAFFAGAALSIKLVEQFKEVEGRYPPGATDFMMSLVCEEINAYLDRHGLKLEWEPHVPSDWKQ